MSAYLHFDEMAWPNPDDPTEIEWRLRYGEPTTKSDRLIAASYIAAYRQLIDDSQRVRNDKIRRIREARALTEEGGQ